MYLKRLGDFWKCTFIIGYTSLNFVQIWSFWFNFFLIYAKLLLDFYFILTSFNVSKLWSYGLDFHYFLLTISSNNFKIRFHCYMFSEKYSLLFYVTLLLSYIWLYLVPSFDPWNVLFYIGSWLPAMFWMYHNSWY